MASFECKVLTPQGQTVTLNMKEKDKKYIYSHEDVRHTGKTFKQTVVDTGVLASFFGQFGDFNLPQSILDGIINARENKQIPNNVLDSIPKSRFEKAKEIFELLKKIKYIGQVVKDSELEESYFDRSRNN